MITPTSLHSPSTSRIIGRYPAITTAPRLVVFGGVHGNEPSGVVALQQVFQQLNELNIPVRGVIVGVLGNQEAFQRNVRYVQEDLNRLFLPEYIRQVRSIPSGHTAEARELLAIDELVETYEAEATGLPFFVDCHTTSSASIPYVSLNEGFTDSYHFAQSMPATSVIGVEKEIRGCLAEWLNRRGWHGFTFEAGQHDAAISVQNQMAIIWLALLYSGCLSEADAPLPIRQARETLRRQGQQQDNVYRTVSSYRIKEGEDFRMEPGYVNLQAVRKGERLAVSDGQPVYATEDAYILMPLYQKQGNFGFFMAKEAGDLSPPSTVHGPQ